MERIEMPVQQGNRAMAWGSDPIAAILREAGFEYIALTPGASYRGLHDSLLLVIVANNLSFFNDELHQERVARQRSRPVENRWIGLHMAAPPLDLAMLARGQGAQGHGPVDTVSRLATVLRQAIAEVRGGAVSVIDVRVAPEYDRAASSGVLRQSQ
jgi:thiamine pyrophosphate-dependent acetolactate synthase large subunit-like protein